MNGELDLEEVYAKRLRTLNPTRGQIRAIRQTYKQNIVPDSIETIAALQMLGHQVYIVSGGLAEPVIDFGRFLGIPRKNIRAVDIEYDQLSGEWWQKLDEEYNDAERFLAFMDGSLVVSDGKALIIHEYLEQASGRSLLVGDGVSDLLAGHEVDLFVGFGGVTRRARVRNEAPLYFETPSMAPLLAIVLGPYTLMTLAQSQFKPLCDRTVQFILDGALEFQSEKLKEKFNKAWNAAYKTFYPRSD